MRDLWFYAQGSQQYGPVSWKELQHYAATGQLQANDLLWREGQSDWTPAWHIHGLFGPSNPLMTPSSPASAVPPANLAPNPNLRIIAGVFAIVLGALGVHKFILGYRQEGTTLLTITLATLFFGALVTVPIGIIEGIVYLTKSDADFHRLYVAGRQQWF